MGAVAADLADGSQVSMAGVILLCLRILIYFGLVTGPFILFQLKKLKNHPQLGSWIARIYLWPTIPLTYYVAKHPYNKIDDTLYLGCMPIWFLGHPQKLRELNVRGIVNMQDENAGPVELYKSLDIKQKRLAVIDHIEPPLPYLKEAVKFIDMYRDLQQCVYVHCKAGHGRAGAVALAWMAYSRNEEPPPASASAVSDDVQCRAIAKEWLRKLNQKLLTMRKVRKTLYEQDVLIEFAVECLKGLKAGQGGRAQADQQKKRRR